MQLPSGWEVRGTADSEFSLTQVCCRQSDVSCIDQLPVYQKQVRNGSFALPPSPHIPSSCSPTLWRRSRGNELAMREKISWTRLAVLSLPLVPSSCVSFKLEGPVKERSEGKQPLTWLLLSRHSKSNTKCRLGWEFSLWSALPASLKALCGKKQR